MTTTRNRSICRSVVIVGALQFTIMTGVEEKQAEGSFCSPGPWMCAGGATESTRRSLATVSQEAPASCKGLFRHLPVSWVAFKCNCVTLLSCFADSITTVGSCCPCFSQLSLVTTCRLQVSPSRAGSQGQLRLIGKPLSTKRKVDLQTWNVGERGQ